MVKRMVQGPSGQSSSKNGDPEESAPGIGSALRAKGAPKVSTSPRPQKLKSLNPKLRMLVITTTVIIIMIVIIMIVGIIIIIVRIMTVKIIAML